MTDSVHRLVHLDLKGAPPKYSYYEKIFPLLHKWGATGLLVEYEDTFPFTGDLSDIAAPHAYTNNEVEALQLLAEEYKFEFIPLVQTFGHFEYVLKHEKFCHLREIPSYPMTLCPLNKGSMELLKKMIDQVIKLHPHIKFFHIGADEVFHLGMCELCHKHMNKNSFSKEQMFFMHVKSVLDYVTKTYPYLKFIMWDDMFRHTEIEVIKGSEIGPLVEPMVWYYHKSLEHLPEGIWERYSQVFDSIWVATAFKGATGPSMFVTDISMHVENHRGWLKLANNKLKSLFKKFRGYAVTGWQRYDHYAVLCELFPVGLPSLAVCMLTLSKETFTEAVHKEASDDLGFKEPIPLCPFQSIGLVPDCNFPGWMVYVGALTMLQLKEVYKQFLGNDRMNGWMSPYHIKHRYANPAHIKHFVPEATELLQQLQQMEGYMQNALADIFHKDTVDEWLTIIIRPKIQEVSRILDTATQLIAVGAKPIDNDNMDDN